MAFTQYVYGKQEPVTRNRYIGVLAVDPGGSTGYVWGVFDLDARTLKNCLAGAYWESGTLTGSEIDQAKALCAIWKKLKDQPTSSVYRFVIEDYIQQPTMHVVDPESLMPIRVAWATIGMMEERFGALAPRPDFQTPGTRMPEQRLKIHDAWIRGRVHERAAMGHMLAFLSQRLR